MISEITFSKKFTAFWNQILPNSKNYIRLINAGLTERVYEPLTPARRKNNIALINVISFELVKAVVERKLTIDDVSEKYFFKSDEFKFISDSSVSFLSKFSYGNEVELPLDSDEINEVLVLYKAIYSRYVANSKTVQVEPEFSGCGFINQANGDIACDGTLIELKSGERNFSVMDLRQTLTYCALNHFMKAPLIIEKIELFNPRMGIAYSEDIESFCQNLSALSSRELFSEIQNFITDINFVEEYGT
ncbi:hypothetical protein [Enterovibrio norvegicus]|uniref:hypothetical protein n=1 Tax=Enterovibrio norvegicus TaxID=188144 RepID=UPI000C84CB74|nr:hypothetical protein [Enterovibrio norvegicus]PMH63926.1 hypothetical protein BCU62_17015 [Enterovibrio norvegicus]